MADTIDNSYKQPNKKGTGYTNIQRVLSSNVGNRLGSAVGQGVQQVGQQAKSNINQAATQFKQDSEQNRLGTAADQQLVQNTINTPGNVSGADTSRFQQLLTGTYKGPQELQNQQQLASKAQQAQFLGQATQNAGGRVELLRRFARPDQASYTQGKQFMDNLLLSQQGDQLRDAKRATQGLSQYAQAQDLGAKGLYQQMVGDSARVGQETQGQLSSGLDNIYSQLEQDRLAAEQNRDQQLAQMQKFSNQGQMTQADIDRFGLQDYVGKYLYGVNLGDYLTKNEDQATLLNTASQEQINHLNALRRLSGNAASIDNQDRLSLFEGTDPAQAQSYQNAPGYEFNQQSFLRALERGKDRTDLFQGHGWDEATGGAASKFAEANSALDRYLGYELAAQVKTLAQSGDKMGAAQLAESVDGGEGVINAIWNMAETSPILQAEEKKRLGLTFNVGQVEPNISNENF